MLRQYLILIELMIFITEQLKSKTKWEEEEEASAVVAEAELKDNVELEYPVAASDSKQLNLFDAMYISTLLTEPQDRKPNRQVNGTMRKVRSMPNKSSQRLGSSIKGRTSKRWISLFHYFDVRRTTSTI